MNTNISLELILIITLICVLAFFPVLILAYWETKRRKKVDIRKELSSWAPFDFMERYFDIKKPKTIKFTDIITKGFQEDYFYTHISEKLNLKEKDEYLEVNKKRRKFEKIWHLVLWITPVLAIISSIIGIKNIKYVMPIIMYFAIIQLRRMPYQKELVPIQKRILQKMYFHLYKSKLNESVFVIRTTRLARFRVPSNYIDLTKVINEINKKHHLK